MILLILTLIVQLISIATVPCEDFNITNVIQNNTLTIELPINNDLLLLIKSVQCASKPITIPVNGRTYTCTELEYGQYGQAAIEVKNVDGNTSSCFLDYVIELQAPLLAYLNVTGDQVRLGITRPMGSFDSVTIRCPYDEQMIVFPNENIPDGYTVHVNCSFPQEIALMNIVLESTKIGFKSAILEILQEVPLPVPFAINENALLLTVAAQPPLPINLYSTYDFRLIFTDNNNPGIIYEQANVTGLNSRLGATFQYGLVPNLTYTVILTHISNPVGYAIAKETFTPILNAPYPFNVTNIHVHEQFNQIEITWNNPHHTLDPINFLIQCYSNDTNQNRIATNQTFICQQMTFNDTDIISIETQVAISGYKYPRTAITQIEIRGVPEIPFFEIIDQTANTIMIEWIGDHLLPVPDSYEYQISCNSLNEFIPISIQSNVYQCQSLEPGTLHIIRMMVTNNDNTIQRSKSINANTLLGKCELRNFLYSNDKNGNRTVWIEWSKPNGNFDTVHVYCPSSFIEYSFSEIGSIMNTSCEVVSGTQYTVLFITSKSGYESVEFRFIEASPAPETTTTATTTTTTIITNITTSTILSPETTGTKINSSLHTTITTTSNYRTTTSSTEIPIENTPNITIYTTETGWRTAAIIAFVFGGFFLIATFGLLALVILVCLRTR